MVISDGAGKPRRRGRWLFAGVLAVALATTAGLLIFERTSTSNARVGQILPAGDELRLDKIKPYGWTAAMDVGTKFTDGLNFLPISPSAKGPIRLLSVTPIMDDGKALKVLGVLARVIPDMLPPNYQTGWFESAPNFPPTDHDATGGVDPAGLVVRAPQATDDLDVELQIGYEVVADGKANKHGVRVRYEYQGHTHEIVIPSHVSICAPATANAFKRKTEQTNGGW